MSSYLDTEMYKQNTGI